MKKQFIIFGISILFIFLFLCGCAYTENNENGTNSETNSESKKFIGTWKHGTIKDKMPIIFSSNGDCKYEGEDAKWNLDNDKLIIKLTDIQNEISFNYEFLDNEKILVLTEIITGHVDDYIKQ
jgi:hypothetical protein